MNTCGRYFNKHDWTQWSDPKFGIVTKMRLSAKEEIPVTYQQRRCMKCNYIETRTVIDAEIVLLVGVDE